MRPDKAKRRRRALVAIAQKRLQVPTKSNKHLAQQAMDAARRGMPCARKVRHTSMELATTAAIKVIEAGRADALSPYRCVYCQGWHLTKQDQGKRMPRLVAKPEENGQ